MSQDRINKRDLQSSTTQKVCIRGAIRTAQQGCHRLTAPQHIFT